MDKRIELLAPAGDWDAFLAAVENGADAVYLGGKLFNARQFAGNFDSGQLKKAIDYAHLRDVKVFLTMNTLIADSEMKEAVECAGEAYSFGIDGVIVQDIGFAGLLKKLFPGLDLHASTQMTIYNLEGANVLEEIGFKRAVLARELPLKEIEHITSNSEIEIEIFIHGALCVCYSGQCLMSSIIGGRSGNRGKCAQPCRLPYELLNGKNIIDRAGGKYLLSPKDLCSIEILHQILNSGVKSLKIEGRMKTPEYVATVVSAYRKYIDRYLEIKPDSKIQIDIDEGNIRNLAQIFNRGGFSKGYLQGKCGRDMMCFEKPKNWGIYLGQVISNDSKNNRVTIKLEEELSIGDGIEIWNGEAENPGTVVSEMKLDGKNISQAKEGQVITVTRLKGRVSKGNKVYKTTDKKLITFARDTYEGKFRRKTTLHGRVAIREGLPVRISVSDNMGNSAVIDSGFIPEKAISRPLTTEKVLEQMNKTGSTPFEFEKIDIELDRDLAVPVSVLNDIRRRVLEDVEQKRILTYRREMSDVQRKNLGELIYFPGNGRNNSNNLKLSLMFFYWDENNDYRNLAVERVYLPFNIFLNPNNKPILDNFKKEGKEVFVWLPSITRGNYDNLIKSKLKEISNSFDGVLIGNLGSIEYVKELPMLKIMGDYSLNIFNSLSVKELFDLNFNGVTLSLESTLSQIKEMAGFDCLTREIVVYGRIPLITSEYCPVGSIAGGCTAGNKCNEACRKGNYTLRDRMGMEFPVFCDRIDCRSTIFNSNVIFISDSLDKVKKSGIDIIRINVTDESMEDIREIIGLNREIAENGKESLDKLSPLIGKIKSRGFTKGHYFRGV